MTGRLLKVLCAVCLLAGCASYDAALAQRRPQSPAPTPKDQPTARTPTAAQDPPAPPMPVLPDIRNDPDVQAADIAIIANITATELRFDAVANPKVEFFEKSKVQSIWHAERFNLPDRIEPGVTYRNVGIRLKIVSRLEDIERIVSEALGEIPLDQGTAPPADKPGSTSKPPAPPAPAPSSPVRRSPK